MLYVNRNRGVNDTNSEAKQVSNSVDELKKYSLAEKSPLGFSLIDDNFATN